jgi:hypothetical protein
MEETQEGAQEVAHGTGGVGGRRSFRECSRQIRNQVSKAQYQADLDKGLVMIVSLAHRPSLGDTHCLVRCIILLLESLSPCTAICDNPMVSKRPTRASAGMMSRSTLA